MNIQRAINLVLYNGERLSDVSVGRWNAIRRFITFHADLVRVESDKAFIFDARHGVILQGARRPEFDTAYAYAVKVKGDPELRYWSKERVSWSLEEASKCRIASTGMTDAELAS